MNTQYGNAKLDELFEHVKNEIRFAKLVAFDGCHKIYLAMDEEQAQWFRDNYNGEDFDNLNFSGTAEEMYAMVRKWWNASCGLRFVQSVRTVVSDPNEGFESLIPQGEWSFDDEYEEF